MIEDIDDDKDVDWLLLAAERKAQRRAIRRYKKMVLDNASVKELQLALAYKLETKRK